MSVKRKHEWRLAEIYQVLLMIELLSRLLHDLFRDLPK